MGCSKTEGSPSIPLRTGGWSVFPFWQYGIDDDGGESDDVDVYGRVDGYHGRGGCVCVGFL